MAKAIAVAENNSGLEKLKSYPHRLRAFLENVRSDMKKVWTPSFSEVQSTTIVVIITVFLFAAFFAIVDYIFGHSIGALLDHLTKQ